MYENNDTGSFIKSLDTLIIKNRKNLGNPGTLKFIKLLFKARKEILNKWFSLFPGLHKFEISLIISLI